MILLFQGIILLGIFFILIGIYGLFRFQNFFARILITSKVEILGGMTIMLGIALLSGFSFFTGKVILIMFLLLITNPLATHSIARSAYKGIKNKEKRK